MRTNWVENLKVSVRAILLFTVLVGGLFPLLITGVAKAFFADKAGGSLATYDGKIVGSTLIAQKHASASYFNYRPSADDYGTVASGASNLSPASQALADAVKKRQTEWGAAAPADLLTASGSGLDPEVSPEAARFQITKVSNARHLSPTQAERLKSIVESHVESKTFGVLGQSRVNVLKLNLALDKEFPMKP